MSEVNRSSRSVRAPVAAAALAASVMLALSLLTGCIFGSGGPSNVAQGKLYRSGDAQFDEFFTGLYALQVELAQAPDRENQIRQSLAQELKSATDAPAELGQAVKDQAQRLAKSGTGLNVKATENVDHEEQAKIDVEAVGMPIDAEGEKLIATVEKHGTEALKLYVVMQGRERLLERMRGIAMTLQDQSDQRFRKSMAQKAEVRKNLEDAQTLIPLMVTRARDVADSAKALFKNIAESAHTDDGSFKPPPPPPPPEEPPPIEEEPPPKKGKGKGKAAPKPAPQPAAAKPDPTTKPAEFEP
jgi:hypothetical protein